MILVDSSVWIAYFNGIENWQANMLDRLLSEELILIGDLILTEVLQGFKYDKDFRNAKEFMSALPFYEMCGYDMSVKSASNYRKLRKKGITVRRTIDVMIGTFCIEKKVMLLHDDHDFEPLERELGLKSVSPDYLH